MGFYSYAKFFEYFSNIFALAYTSTFFWRQLSLYSEIEILIKKIFIQTHVRYTRKKVPSVNVSKIVSISMIYTPLKAHRLLFFPK